MMAYRQVLLLLFLVHLIGVNPGRVRRKNKTITSPKLLFDMLERQLDIYRELTEKGKNVFFSPVSIGFGMGMAFAGSKKNTEKQMKKVLGMTRFKSKKYNNKLLGNVRYEFLWGADEGKNYNFSIASRLYGSKEYKFHKKFLKDTGMYYDAALEPVNFSDDSTRKSINEWVSETTHNKIQNFFSDPIDPQTKLILVNAIYFAGYWEETFDPEKTEVSTFTKSDGTEIDVDMMHIATKYENAYIVKYKCDVIQLPYKGGNLSMVIILPRTNSPLSLEQEADAILETVEMLKENNKATYFYKKHLEVYIPKFRLEADFSLTDIYKKLGMKDAFQAGKADFSNMEGSKNIFLGDITHKSFIVVNEKGTEAAAATAVKVTTRSRISKFAADHPFLFFITDRRNEALLFVGKVEDPPVAGSIN